MINKFLSALVGIVLNLTCAALLAAQPPAPPTGPAPISAVTYCNPIPLPDYPLGRYARDAVPGAPVPSESASVRVQRIQDSQRTQ